MLFGLALMAVPLLAAILTAVLQIRDLSDTGQKIVLQGVSGARASQALFGQIASLERTARLHEVLKDPKLLDAYKSQDERLSSLREQLHTLATGDARITLEELGQLQEGIRAGVMSNSGADPSASFAQLSELVERVAQQSNAQVDAEVAALRERTLKARQQLLWLAALLLPLANIREGTELLMDGAVGELDSNQREVAAILRENGIKLQRMIENLLSFSAWQTSSVGLEATEFRLRPLVKQVLENQQLTLLSQRVRLDVRVEDLTLIADRGKIRLILENLVSNAVKYSPKGGTIHLQARAAGPQLVLDVADSGPGIPPEDREHVFEAFYTGRAARATAVKGTGIGLSVVLEFVAAHGGSVQIIDGQFPGAHFRITMPLRAGSGDRPRVEPKAHAHAA